MLSIQSIQQAEPIVSKVCMGLGISCSVDGDSIIIAGRLHLAPLDGLWSIACEQYVQESSSTPMVVDLIELTDKPVRFADALRIVIFKHVSSNIDNAMESVDAARLAEDAAACL